MYIFFLNKADSFPFAEFYKMGFMPDVFSNSNIPTKVSVTFDDAKGVINKLIITVLKNSFFFK